MANENTSRNIDTLQFMIDSDLPSDVIFAIKESYKTIRANIVLSLVKDGCKKLVITSSVPAEGKTTTSINLAIALSMVDKKVLLIDSDLRKNRIGKYLKLQHNKGLTDIIRDEATFEEVLNITKFPNLHILASGSSVINPAEVIASKLTQMFLDKVSENYDYIILDAPPINIVSDALPLIKNSDGVIFVAREMFTNHREIKKALSSLSLIEAPILGLVYIGSDTTQPYYHSTYYGRYGKYGKYGKYGRYGKYNHYGKYYGYGYGYSDDTPSKKKKNK